MLFVKKDNPDRTQILPMCMSVLTEAPELAERALALTTSAARNVHRDWFTPHFYNCLPLVIANQYGFSILLESDTVLLWNGGESSEDLTVYQPRPASNAVQNVHSHFGSGIVTLDHPWVYRTHAGTNLLVMAPPNHPIDGLAWMMAVVESDNLRTDFTLNIKLTRPHHEIKLDAGTPIGHFLPVPRHFCDGHILAVHPEGDALEAEREAMRDFHKLRHERLAGKLGRHYRAGFDLYGTPFVDHQRK